jgi:hypothetical protein
MEKAGKSGGTIWSYGMELQAAQAELGADTLVGMLTPEDIRKFETSKRVNKLAKSGKPKAEPSVAKTKRVLRLAVTWAAETGLIAANPYATEPAPERAKPKRRGRGLELEVPQKEAEAAADVAEAAIREE